MRFPQWNLGELLLATAFIGLFTALAVRTWGGFFFLPGLAMAGIPLFLGYLLLVLMIRQHRRSEIKLNYSQ